MITARVIVILFLAFVIGSVVVGPLHFLLWMLGLTLLFVVGVLVGLMACKIVFWVAKILTIAKGRDRV